MEQIIDITMPLYAGMLAYPGTPEFSLRRYRNIASGDTSNNSEFSMGTHVGTHVDAPLHYVEGGGTIDDLDPRVLIGPCRVFHLETHEIGPASLCTLDLSGVTRALFRTPSSGDLSDPGFKTEFAHVTGEGADLLASAGIRLVGVDYLSLDRYKAPGHPAHNTLLAAGVVVIEGVDLSGVEPGDYELICCPLLIRGAEAAPARVFLRR